MSLVYSNWLSCGHSLGVAKDDVLGLNCMSLLRVGKHTDVVGAVLFIQVSSFQGSAVIQ